MYASKLKPRIVAPLVVFLGIVGSGHAADRDAEQLKRLKMQLRQVQQQQEAAVQEAQAKAAADKAALEQSLKSVKSEAGATKAAAAAASRRVADLNNQINDLTSEKSALTEQVAQLQKQLEAQKVLAQSQSEQWRGQLADQKGLYQALVLKNEQCRQDNAAMYIVGKDLLARYENKGFGEVFAVKEPFVQTARVKLENLITEYQDKLDAAKVKASANTPTP